MKKLIIIAALMVAATVGRAQLPTPPQSDTVTVMLSHLKDTNAELARIDKAFNLHAAMVGVGSAADLIGCVFLINSTRTGEEYASSRFRAGVVCIAGGAIVTALSFIPVSRAGVSLDERGLVVRPSELRKR